MKKLTKRQIWSKKYYKDNKKRINKQSKLWAKNNPGRAREYVRNSDKKKAELSKLPVSERRKRISEKYK